MGSIGIVEIGLAPLGTEGSSRSSDGQSSSPPVSMGQDPVSAPQASLGPVVSEVKPRRPPPIQPSASFAESARDLALSLLSPIQRQARANIASQEPHPDTGDIMEQIFISVQDEVV